MVPTLYGIHQRPRRHHHGMRGALINIYQKLRNDHVYLDILMAQISGKESPVGIFEEKGANHFF